MTIQAIFCEAGHGKSLIGTKDVGAVRNYGGSVYRERDMAKELARRVLAILKAKKELGEAIIQGVGVETDANIRAKMKYVNTVMAENKLTPSKCLGVAIHMNASISNQPRGFEVWHQRSGKAKAIGEYLIRAWQKYAICPLRPNTLISTDKHRYGKLYIDDTICPYVLVETGFISNYADVMAISGDYDRAAEAIAHGIMEYVRSR